MSGSRPIISQKNECQLQPNRPPSKPRSRKDFRILAFWWDRFNTKSESRRFAFHGPRPWHGCPARAALARVRSAALVSESPMTDRSQQEPPKHCNLHAFASCATAYARSGAIAPLAGAIARGPSRVHQFGISLKYRTQPVERIRSQCRANLQGAGSGTIAVALRPHRRDRRAPLPRTRRRGRLPLDDTNP